MTYRPHPCEEECQLNEARRQFAAAQQTLMQAGRSLEQAQRLTGRTTEGKPMSQALWCDAGEHAFSSRDPKAERWDRTMKNEQGEPVTIPWDVCGECLGGMGTPGFNMKERHAIMEGKLPSDLA